MTRLVTRDAFPPALAVRTAIERKFGEDHWITYLTQCDWCAGWWVTGGVVGLSVLFVSVPLPILVWAAAAAVVGLIAANEPE